MIKKMMITMPRFVSLLIFHSINLVGSCCGFIGTSTGIRYVLQTEFTRYSRTATRYGCTSKNTFLYLIVTNKCNKMFSQSVYDTIGNGQIAVIPNFVSPYDVATLRHDAMDLYEQGYFTSDALSSYGTKQQFDPTKDRNVLKLNQWNNPLIGNYQLRNNQFASKIADVRNDLSYNLHRPKLRQGTAVTKYGIGSTEISYTRFGPGATLARHVDEHHEELKGVNGWYQPTRRSLSWLIYINDNKVWDPNKDGGSLRCYERRFQPPTHTTGSRTNGDLQIGWLIPTVYDPYERPVFMDLQYNDNTETINSNSHNSKNHQCALYIDNDYVDSTDVDTHFVMERRLYISAAFPPNPTLYLAGASEYILQKVYISQQINKIKPKVNQQQQQQLASIFGDSTTNTFSERFRFIEAPKSRFSSLVPSSSFTNDYEIVHDVAPMGGTLVLFDSVTLPHEVLPSLRQQRWACSGWMHEDQQPISK